MLLQSFLIHFAGEEKRCEGFFGEKCGYMNCDEMRYWGLSKT